MGERVGGRERENGRGRESEREKGGREGERTKERGEREKKRGGGGESSKPREVNNLEWGFKSLHGEPLGMVPVPPHVGHFLPRPNDHFQFLFLSSCTFNRLPRFVTSLETVSRLAVVSADIAITVHYDTLRTTVALS